MIDADKQRTDTAIKAVFEMRKNNPTWPMSFICSKISNWHQVDYHILINSIRGKNTGPIKRRKLKSAEDSYGGKIPYWAKD